MTDIVERLTKETGDWILAHELMEEAADEIERLRAKQQQMALEYLTAEGQWIEETRRLREALQRIKKICAEDGMPHEIRSFRAMDEARTALEEKE